MILFCLFTIFTLVILFVCYKRIKPKKNINEKNIETKPRIQTINESKKIENNKPKNVVKKEEIFVGKKNYKQKLIYYWAPWCKICTGFKPKWEIIKNKLLQEYKNLLIEEVNCEDINKCFFIKNKKRGDIDGVPTILLRTYNEDDIEYEANNNLKGNKEYDDIVKFINLNLKK